MNSTPAILKDRWDKLFIVSKGAGRFPIPPSCVVCRSFDALFETVDMNGNVMANRNKLVVSFRNAHHNPLYAMVDRDEYLMNRLKKGGWPDRKLREVARLIALVGPECGYSRPVDTEWTKK